MLQIYLPKKKLRQENKTKSQEKFPSDLFLNLPTYLYLKNFVKEK